MRCCRSWKDAGVILVLDEVSAMGEIASRERGCPCGGRLWLWGHARVRLIRQLNGSHTSFRPRRLACAACRKTQVVLPAECLPRRRDSVESIGAALLMATNGRGHRTIVAELDLPASTVRNWLRRARQRGRLAPGDRRGGGLRARPGPWPNSGERDQARRGGGCTWVRRRGGGSRTGAPGCGALADHRHGQPRPAACPPPRRLITPVWNLFCAPADNSTTSRWS